MHHEHECDKKRVLIIEDNSFFSHVLFQILSRDGFDVHFAERRADALQTLLNYSFDVILCDYNLPDVQGSSLLKLLHKLIPRVPVVVLSGEQPPNLNELIDNGIVNKFLLKPCTREELLMTLESLLSDHTVTAEKED